MQVISDPVWLGLIFTALCLLAAIIVPIVIYLKSKNKKEISYEVITQVPLLNIKDEVKDNFEVLFHGKPVGDATFLIVHVWNSGNAPIEEEDFIDPIKLSFGLEAKIFFARLGSLPGQILGTIGTIGDNTITFKPRLLNKGYFISVSAMVTDFNEDVTAEGLIKGIYSIRNAKTTLSPFPFRIGLLILSYLIGISSLSLGLIAIIDLNRQNYFIKTPTHLTSELVLFALISLLIAFFSACFFLTVLLSRLIEAVTNKSDKIYHDSMKHTFSQMHAIYEEESQKQTSQRSKKLTPLTPQGTISKKTTSENK